MVLLLVGISLTVCMVYITRLLINSLMPERFRGVMRLLIPAYLLLNLYFTLLMRSPSEDCPVILVPLHAGFAMLGWDIRTYSQVQQLLPGTWSEPVALTFEPLVGIAQNLVLFLPFGFLLQGASRKPNALRIVCWGFGLSLAVEVCQMLFHLGWFEVDDMLHNALGTLLGVWLYRWTGKRRAHFTMD